MIRGTATLCLGPVDLVNGGTAWPSSHPWVQVEVPAPYALGANTVHLIFGAETASCKVVAWNGDVVAEVTQPGSALFDGMQLAGPLADVLRLHRAGMAYAPLFLGHADADRIHLYSQVRFTGRDALFIRTGSTTQGESDLPWLRAAWQNHQEQTLFLNNHQCYYRKVLRGKEIEVKFTLQGVVDIWGMTLETLRRIERGQLPGFIPEYRDEFQQWDYVTHLFDIPSPPEERGYVSFLPTTDGRDIVKRKRFVVDQRVRDESISAPLQIEGAYEDWIAQSLGVVATRLPALRRVRYDVNLESLVSGHVYGIFFDRCTVEGHDAVLQQCEVEYLRSRCLGEPDEASMWTEFETVLQFVRELLTEHQLPWEEGYTSKLTFLRDVTGAE